MGKSHQHAPPTPRPDQAPASQTAAVQPWGNSAAQSDLGLGGSDQSFSEGPVVTPSPGSSTAAAAPAAQPDLDGVLTDLASVSPALSAAIDTARAGGFIFRYGVLGGGTFTDAAASPPEVVIDPGDVANGELAMSLSHELGHVADGDAQYVQDASWDRNRYITENTMVDLRGEAEATIMELQVRDELTAAGRADPGISGATSADKIRLWGEFTAGTLSRADLVEAIALLFARGESPSTASGTYWNYYGQFHADAWDANHPTPTPLPLPPAP